MEKTRAILLRRHKLTESSLIVSWCTESSGIIRTVAKGARGAKSPFAGKLDLFCTGDIEFARSRGGGELHVLCEAVISDHREGLQKDYERLRLASYFGALIELVAEIDTPVPGLFALLDKALAYVAGDADPSPRALERFEQRVAEHLGILEEGEDAASPSEAISAAYGRLPKGRP